MLKNFFYGASLMLLLTGLGCSSIHGHKPGSQTSLAANVPEEGKIGGFLVGCQAYTFNRFTVFEAIEKTRQAGGKTIEFYPNQKLSAEQPEVKWDHNASDELIQKVKAKLDQEKIRAVNYGVVRAKNEMEWRKIFEFAKKLGLYGITIEAVEDLDTIEPLVKEYNICVGIHEHARRPNDPSYKVWDPNYVLSMVKNRDPRIGVCADTGHWATSGVQPLEAFRILRGRIISCHLKDRPVIGEERPDTILGTGVSNIGGILAELKRQGFRGNISLEYENNWDHSVPDVAQCIGFIRGWADGQNRHA
jgi:sugar phosphate isomerase/epimerase